MHKIYFEENALIIANSPSAFSGIPNLYYIGDDELHKSYKILISNESNGRAMNFGVVSQDPEETLRDFLAEYRVIQAAGGLVFNKEAQLLSILRNGIWDLPKGKIEKHEDQRAAALREVMEETGLNMINISEKIGATYHGYFEDNSVLLKETHWYFMQSNGNGKPVPQMEEGITDVQWVDLDFFKNPELKTYKSIKNIIQRALDLLFAKA
ncbi:MAG: NUDIX domain-containing protein [Bacteroidia bacterium]|jgi:8-oxo-dGTP pyrophosphatase MutT (NUDIX family)|nr:NUDIX domain-containing protein [Bacteroidia bacterium]